MAPDLTKAAGVGLTGVILSALGSQLKVFQLPKESRGLEDAGRMSQQVSTLIGDTYKQLAELVQSTQNPASLANAEMILSTLERVREVTTNQVNAENGIRLKISKETNNAMSASIAIWGIAWVVSVGIMIAVVSDALSLLVFVATSANGAFQIIRGKLVDDPVYQV